MIKDMFPYLGALPLASINAPALLTVVRKAEARGAHETAHTLRQTARQVFRYGIQTGRCDRDPSTDLHGTLKPAVVKHMAAILEPVKVGELMRAIHSYAGQPTTRTALVLSALLFQRPGNIRQMEWTWIDFDNAMLTIPSQDMKRRMHQKINGRPYLVPLAPQALAALAELRPLTGHGRYVFPSLLTGERPMSDNTVNLALRRMDISKEEMTAHGFRATARTLLIERLPGITDDVIEAQLAHGKSGPLGSAYDRAELMEQRRKMMTVWADYLDKLRIGADVIVQRMANEPEKKRLNREAIQTLVRKGLVNLRVIEPSVKVVYKNITVESTRDKEFLDVLRKAVPAKELAHWFHIFDAAPVVPLGQRT
jgi:integrase